MVDIDSMYTWHAYMYVRVAASARFMSEAKLVHKQYVGFLSLSLYSL